MEKLTLKELQNFRSLQVGERGSRKTITTRMVNELIEYKKLEEELGCPLDVYVKLHKIVYIYTKVGKRKLLKVLDGFIVVKVYGNTTYLPLSDYKKTWWLKEDKSE